jgi:hypothetical protein
LVIASCPVFLGFQADALFHLPSSLCRRFSGHRLILSSSAFRVIASVIIVSVVRLRIPLSRAFGYADHIVPSSRVRRAKLRSLSGSRFTRRRSLWANPALNPAPFSRWTLRDKAAQRRLALRSSGDNPLTIEI